MKIQKYLLLTAVAALLLGYAACKDDDDPKTSVDPTNTDESDDPEDTALKYWEIVGQLVGSDQYTADYANATFEPTIGTAEGNTHIVATNTMAAAAQHFADLVGASGIDETTSTYTFNDPKIGTLTYTKVNDGTTLATVDVNIKQIPHLDQIVYRSGSDDNASFGDQKAWYRFGDIVKRTTAKGYVEYWICVRPAFSYEKKGDSHWVCLSLTDEYTFYHAGSNKIDYWVPTQIGKDVKNMRNFAEMLFAITNPQEWYDNCINNSSSKMPIFNDFSVDNIKFHNQYFWQNVQDAWKHTEEVAQALKMPLSSIKVKENGVKLLYNGYSWYTKTSWNLSLYQYSFTNGTGKNANMHTEENSTIKKNVKAFTSNLDCRTMGSDLDKYNNFFEDGQYRWVIRHATGKDLNGGIQPAATAEIQGVTEVYRYYSYYTDEKTRKGDKADNGPEVTPKDKEKKYEEYGSICEGTIIRDANGTNWFCYAAWRDTDGVAKTRDHKARFISFDGLTRIGEILYGSSETGFFARTPDLLPEEEAPWAAAILTFLFNYQLHSGALETNDKYIKAREQICKTFDITEDQYKTIRDSTLEYNGVTADGWLWGLSVLYKPTGSWTFGTQPYLRCIFEGSGMNERTKLPQWMKYPRLRFFKKYNDASGKPLDLAHTFAASKFVTKANPIKADEFSRATRNDTHLRDGDFTAADRYNGIFEALEFTYKPAQYQSPYREKVVAVRYMELDDPSGDFHTVYDDKHFTLVWKPEDNDEFSIRNMGFCTFADGASKNTGSYNWCTMDGQKYDIGYYTYNMYWPDATDGE